MADDNKPSEPPQQQSAAESTPRTLPRTDEQIPGVNNMAPKTTWPELVGSTAEEAERKIKEEMPGAFVQVIQPGSFVTMDFRTNRVRLYVDSTGKVDRTPMIG